MDYKALKRIIGAIVFLISAVVLFSTVQPSVSFWDCGEFTAAAYYLQVPHPPGSPFFTILGRAFAMIPFVTNIALRVNTISVLASAFSVFFLYLIAVKLIENYKGKEPKNIIDALATYLAAAIGALSFSFSDTFWFNGVEAEVYASSTFLFAAITYLMIRWNERADKKDSEKYILMIAYLIGISTGVHLMSILAIVSVVMIIMFRKYVDDEAALKKSTYFFLAHAAIVIVLAFILWSGQTGTTPPGTEIYQAFDTKFKLIMAALSAVFIGLFWKKLLNKNSIYLPLIIGGIALFLTYPGIVKILPGIMTSISGDSVTTAVLLLALIFGILGYLVYYSTKKNKPTLHLVFMSIIMIILGFTTYTMIIIRSNQNPPMNENRPDDFSELVSYLNREQYGDFPIFKRRFSQESRQRGVFTNYSNDFDFFWNYQMNHMMTRYWLWNYAGRASWVQDAGPDIAPFNKIGNVFGRIFNIHFEGQTADSLFGIPFLLGLLGIYFQFRKDWKMALVFMVLFIFMGYLTAFYQNQQQPQPRERDYFYVGAFFVFSIWIALGVRGIIDFIQQKIRRESLNKAAIVGAIALGIIFVPFRMYEANYFTHDRSQNWVPWDYSYNMLQSCAPNSILFTNGDNDTFPLWYLQDVEGVRRDVKIVNLSLLNTPWYILQLKHRDPYNVGKVNITIPDAQIENIGPMRFEPQNITIQVPNGKNGMDMSVFKNYDITDSSVIKAGQLTFRMNNTVNYGNIKAIRIQDIVAKNIVQANNWKRPIYFAVTCSNDSKLGMDPYLRLEGMAERFVPQREQRGRQFVDAKILEEQVFRNESGFSKSYKPGFKFRGLNNENIFFDDTQQRMLQNYRNAFIGLAMHYLHENNNDLVIKTLDKMETTMPRKIFTMQFGLLYQIGTIYFRAGASNQYKLITKEVEKDALQRIDENPNDIQSYYNPYRILIDVYQNLKEYKKLAGIWKRIQAMYPNDPNVKANVLKYSKLASEQDSVNASTN